MSRFDEHRLDDPDERAAIDSGDLLRALATAGAQVRSAAVAAADAGIPRPGEGDRPRGVLIAAMGADELVADTAATLCAEGSPVLVAHSRSGALPGWVGPLDLVIAVSLSGAAVGPVGLAAEAGRRGATVVGVGAPLSPLADVVARARGRFLPVGDLGAGSRARSWSLLVPVLLTLEGHGILPDVADRLDDVANRLDDIAAAARPSSEAFVNPAKLLAADLAGTIPLVLGDGPLTGVAARRAGTMLTLTARTPALTGQLPDCAAALLACLDGPFAASSTAPDGGRDIFADPDESAELALVLLRDVVDESPTDAAMRRHNLAQSVQELATGRGTRVHEVNPAAGSPLVRLAELIARVDFAAAYLAIGLGLDPLRSPAVRALRDHSQSAPGA